MYLDAWVYLYIPFPKISYIKKRWKNTQEK